jgi:outer membrane protein W
MGRFHRLLLAAFVLAAVAGARAQVETEPVSPASAQIAPSVPLVERAADKAYPADAPSWMDPLRGHLEVGTRITVFNLIDKERSSESEASFLGRIRKLEEDPDYLPTKLFAAWMFNPNVGLELSLDRMSMETFNRSEDDFDVFIAGDGTLDVSAICLTLFGRYVNESVFAPYGGAGLAYLWGDFNEDAWWFYNYPDEATYVAAGSPQQANKGFTREISLDSSLGYLGVLGTAVALTDSWSLDLYARLLIGTLDAKFRKERKGSEVTGDDGEFPVDSWTLGAGVRYAF